MNKKIYNCDCRYIIVDGIVYDHSPCEDCEACKGRGWYLGEENES